MTESCYVILASLNTLGNPGWPQTECDCLASWDYRDAGPGKIQYCEDGKTDDYHCKKKKKRWQFSN